MAALIWQQYASGVWRGTIGEPSALSPVSWMNREPKYEALHQLGDVPLPFSMEEIRSDYVGAMPILSFPLTEQEAIYGMGLQFARMNQRGRTRFLRVNSDPKQDTGETHAPVPFFVSDCGYGVLIDTSRVTTVYCGSTVHIDDNGPEAARDRNTDKAWRATPLSSRMEVRLPEEGATVYLFSGPTLVDVVKRYNLFCGGGTLPPRWGLGFWHRVPKLYNDKMTLAEAREFRERGIPCDVIGLEPGWHSRSYPVTYEWSEERFPNPSGFVRSMEQLGFRINLWEHPYISPDASIFEAMKPLSGSHTVWGGLAPDYTLKAAQELYMNQHIEQHASIGVSGYKLDECDGSELTNHSWMFPAHASFPSGADGEQMRQMYGLLFQKMTSDLYRKHNRRTYGLVRASNAAASTLPYVLYSDLYDHKQFIRALSNASFSGILWTPEVRKADNSEEWVRRMQSVCFSPMAMLNAWGDGTKPWSFPEVEPIIRHYIELRMRLLPYFYTAFARYCFEGLPPFRAMPLAFESADQYRKAASKTSVDHGEVLNTTDAAYGKQRIKEWDDQFLIGDDLLVAPMFSGERGRDVLLPPGVWYGFETGVRYEGEQVVHIQAPLELIPIFVREGAVIPMMPVRQHAPNSTERTPLEWLHFGSVPGRGMLFDDDGVSFDYERGKHIWQYAEVTVDERGDLLFEMKEKAGAADALSSYSSVTWRLGLKSIN
ncbi:TIM-barrel domain-containing protein [Paenibacillus silviterrae]|uniref:TIM-barrel domain-containing protein n=1 Tax=Paenibacillus silviterrae TaxID=3242194 RepID=UPI002542748B|nr:TIM-barrel domain-containing protein [Paenibacillus chinjuensis]